eukprot:3638091-Prymnesium_polylepis.1
MLGFGFVVTTDLCDTAERCAYVRQVQLSSCPGTPGALRRWLRLICACGLCARRRPRPRRCHEGGVWRMPNMAMREPRGSRPSSFLTHSPLRHFFLSACMLCI